MRMSDRPKNNRVCASVGMLVCTCLIDLKYSTCLCLNVCVRMFDRSKTVSSYAGMFVCECLIDLKHSLILCRNVCVRMVDRPKII